MLQRQVQLGQLVVLSRGGGLNYFVGQVVAERCRNGQRLHLLGGSQPADRHPTHVLETGNATRTLPEEHTSATSPSSKDTSFSGEGTAEAVREGADGLRGFLLDAPETHHSVISDAGEVAAVRAEAHRANPAVIGPPGKNGRWRREKMAEFQQDGGLVVVPYDDTGVIRGGGQQCPIWGELTGHHVIVVSLQLPDQG